MLTSKGSAGEVEGIKVNHNGVSGLTNNAIFAVDAEVQAHGNHMINCGNAGGVALIRVGQGFADISNNIGRRGVSPPGSAFQYGIQWDGAAHARRTKSDNRFYDFSGSAENGTM